MPLHPTWEDIALRLILVLIAGGIIGFNRGVRGEAAGLRTTILVGLAACVAMIQANILLPVGGRTPDSFGVMDLMRLPLGILTGVGFIGAGAILRRGTLLTGVTTAATLWLITVIGLCFGGGQFGLGGAATLLGIMTLWSFRWLDRHIPREQRAVLEISTNAGSFSPTQVRQLIGPLGYEAQLRRQQNDGGKRTKLWYDIKWRCPEAKGPPADLLKLINEHCPDCSFEIGTEPHH